MSAFTALVLITLAWLAMGAGLLVMAYLLVMSGHPVFAVLAGLCGAACLSAASDIKVKGERN